MRNEVNDKYVKEDLSSSVIGNLIYDCIDSIDGGRLATYGVHEERRVRLLIADTCLCFEQARHRFGVNTFLTGIEIARNVSQGWPINDVLRNDMIASGIKRKYEEFYKNSFETSMTKIYSSRTENLSSVIKECGKISLAISKAQVGEILDYLDRQEMYSRLFGNFGEEVEEVNSSPFLKGCIGDYR
ncbi:hypothetical protein KA107_02410 [Candidatus Pacearchaeota archaeon]|nr:hypothetical protein [Candidatus Pacearchaeota archaeon]